jgi:hypothetical protein
VDLGGLPAALLPDHHPYWTLGAAHATLREPILALAIFGLAIMTAASLRFRKRPIDGCA